MVGHIAYSRICLITWRGSAPADIAEIASLVNWSRACCSNASAIEAALRTISSASSGGKVVLDGSGR